MVETLAWPSHSGTLAISASCESALVAAVARREWHPQAFYFGADVGLEPAFLHDVAINGGRIERPVEGICRATSCIRNAQALTGPNCTHLHAFNLRATEYFGYNFSLS